MKWSIGCDPELFAVNPEGKFIPIFDKIGGTKAAPLKYDHMPTGMRLATRSDALHYQEDGAALEFNITPATNSGHFLHNVLAAMTMCDQLLAPHMLRVKVSPVAKFSTDMLEHPKAATIGCSADMTAYKTDGEHGSEEREPPDVASMGNRRYAGGHIHIGYDKSLMPGWVAARFADLYLGLPSLRFDKQHKRRAVYGLAGTYREKPYGIEYRTLSPTWLANRARMTQMSWSVGEFAKGLVRKDVVSSLSDIWDTIPWKDVYNIIEKEDVVEAKKFVNIYRRKLPFYEQAQYMMSVEDKNVELDGGFHIADEEDDIDLLELDE